jgi:hypothetical protein
MSCTLRRAKVAAKKIIRYPGLRLEVGRLLVLLVAAAFPRLRMVAETPARRVHFAGTSGRSVTVLRGALTGI